MRTYMLIVDSTDAVSVGAAASLFRCMIENCRRLSETTYTGESDSLSAVRIRDVIKSEFCNKDASISVHVFDITDAEYAYYKLMS